MDVNTWVTNGPANIVQQFGVNPAAYARFGLAGHDGVDLYAEDGQELYAPVEGTIRGPYYDPLGWGINLAVETDDGSRWYLCHLQDVGDSRDGDHVVVGTPICHAGRTGNTDGMHVHVVYHPWLPYIWGPYRGRVDPLPFLLRTR